MAHDRTGSPSFLATAAATSYPLINSLDGTSTAASSSMITSRVACIESVVVEHPGSADGTLTLSDHAGTKSFALDHKFAAPKDWHYGTDGMEVPGWTGIKAVMATGTGARLRIVFRPA